MAAAAVFAKRSSMVDDILVGLEDAAGEPIVAHELRVSQSSGHGFH
jgi:hypothetical protein